LFPTLPTTFCCGLPAALAAALATTLGCFADVVQEKTVQVIWNAPHSRDEGDAVVGKRDYLE
jgi:hypothetical protein